MFQAQALELGLDKASKLEGRNTAQGLIGVIVKGNCASMVELNCETDFVARNSQFHELLNEVALATHTAGCKISLEGGNWQGLRFEGLHPKHDKLPFFYISPG